MLVAVLLYVGILASHATTDLPVTISTSQLSSASPTLAGSQQPSIIHLLGTSVHPYLDPGGPLKCLVKSVWSSELKQQNSSSFWLPSWFKESCVISVVAFAVGYLVAAVVRSTRRDIHIPLLSLVETTAGSTENMTMAAVMGSSAGTSLRSPLTVIFDIDGTLCDSFQLGFDASNKVLQENGHSTITPETYHMGTKYTTPVRLAWHAGYEWDSDAFKSAGAKMGAEFDEYYIGLVSPSTAAFYSGLRPLVEHLGAICQLGALTNAAVAYAHAVLDANAVHNLFDVIHGADDVPAPKPKPDGLLQCCSELGIAPSQAIYVGDSPSDGVAAKAAGMQSIGVAWGSHSVDSLQANFDVVVHSVAELRSILLSALRSPVVPAMAEHPTSFPDFRGIPFQPSECPSPWLFLLDRDGVINHDVGEPGVVAEDQLSILPGVAEAITTLNQLGHVCSVVTNQTAIRKGLLTEDTLQAINSYIRRDLFYKTGAYLDHVIFATGLENSPLKTKPSPDMLLEASRLSGIPMSRAVMIGDTERDMEAAKAAQCAYRILVTSSHHGKAAAAKLQAQGANEVVAPDLMTAVNLALQWIEAEESKQLTRSRGL